MFLYRHAYSRSSYIDNTRLVTILEVPSIVRAEFPVYAASLRSGTFLCRRLVCGRYRYLPLSAVGLWQIPIHSFSVSNPWKAQMLFFVVWLARGRHRCLPLSAVDPWQIPMSSFVGGWPVADVDAFLCRWLARGIHRCLPVSSADAWQIPVPTLVRGRRRKRRRLRPGHVSLAGLRLPCTLLLVHTRW